MAPPSGDRGPGLGGAGAEGQRQFQPIRHPILLLSIPAVVNEKQIKFHSTISTETI